VRSTFRFDRFVDGDDACAVFTYGQGDTNDQSDEELRLLVQDWKHAMIYDLPEKRPYLLQVWNTIREVDLPSLRAEFGKLQILVNWLEVYKAFFKVDGRLQQLIIQWVSMTLNTYVSVCSNLLSLTGFCSPQSDTMQQELAGLEGRWYSYGFQRRELRIKWEVGMYQYVWRSRLREHYKDDEAKLWAINQIAPLEERPQSHTDDNVTPTHRTMYIHLRLCQEELTAKIRNNVFAVEPEAA